MPTNAHVVVVNNKSPLADNPLKIFFFIMKHQERAVSQH